MPSGSKNMTLRKVYQLDQSLAITLPKPICQTLGIKKGGYVEVYLKDGKTIIIKNHGKEPKGITIND